MRQGRDGEQPECVLRFNGIKDLASNVRARTGLDKYGSVRSLRAFFAEYPCLLVHPDGVDALGVVDLVIVRAVAVPLLAAASEGASGGQLAALLANWPAWSYLQTRTAQRVWCFVFVPTRVICVHALRVVTCLARVVDACVVRVSYARVDIAQCVSARVAHKCVSLE